ncbi:asparaginase domain-containing protein [Microbacterium sp. BR1]|uniref:asparaginase domain-containing protein n=1 Tax=Microbacterium sp. BR1 TaxID=1070896 RepID=UPI0012FDCEBB|nr:asparaginase domain-containing protein [Microbacterium sp. BR1]
MRVTLLGTGGTIASTSLTDKAVGVTPRLDALSIARSIGAVLPGIVVTARDILLRPSPSLTLEDVVAMRDAARREIDAGSNGVVLTHGTSSLEESAFALSLLWDRDAPLVVTGAIRNPSLAGSDGPSNVRSAIVAAASPHVTGVVVAFDGELWLPRHLRKIHTNSASPFDSRQTGRIGWISEDTASIALRPAGVQRIALDKVGVVPQVALISAPMGDDGSIPRLLLDSPVHGVVVEGMGGGHVPATWLEPLSLLAARVPVVIASRVGAGVVFRSSYTFPGSDIDLAGRGLVGSGSLDGRKARILLQILLAAGAGDNWAAAFEALSGTSDAQFPPRERNN